MSVIQYHTFLPLFLLLAAAGLPEAATGGASHLIKSTCLAATNSTWSTPYRYCVRTLSADPVAASVADVRGLAAAAANLTVVNVTSTLLVLTRLMGSLQNCLYAYNVMNGSLLGGLDDLRAGRLDMAWPKLKDASYIPNLCELALVEGNPDKDPLIEENDSNMLLSAMTYDITELIADPPF